MKKPAAHRLIELCGPCQMSPFIRRFRLRMAEWCKACRLMKFQVGIVSHDACVRYYALTDYLHVLKLVGLECAAFGLGCTAFLCNGYFEIRTSTVLGWISTSVLRPCTPRLRRASSTFSWLGPLALPSGFNALILDERYRRYIIEINIL